MNIVELDSKRKIGIGHRCFIAAEVGINHNGDLDLAHKTIDAAADAGVDGVKFQNYVTEEFILDRKLMYEYISQGNVTVETQWDMFKRCELKGAELLELKRHCDERGVVFFSTPMGSDGIQVLVDMNVQLLKNGSDCIVYLRLIEEMARTGIPTIMSTGMATLSEIDEAVRVFYDHKGKDLVLLHCVSSYPTLAKDVNLKKMSTLQSVFNCPVGYSDHTEGITAALGSVALGANFIEKHFTLSRNMPGPDHWFSSDPSEMTELVDAVRRLEDQLGKHEIHYTKSEIKGRREFRFSCVASRDIPADQVLENTDIIISRPGGGLSPRFIDIVVGMRLRTPMRRGELFRFENLA